MESVRATPAAEAPQRERAPFAVNRVLWTDADYERKHEEMKDLPCLRGVETYASIRDTLHDLRTVHADDPAFAWKEGLGAFEPQRVAMRYNGEDWSHRFHKQPKYGAKEGEGDESSVTWIAKHLVRRISELTRACKRRLEQEPDEGEREALKKGLVQDVEQTVSLFYYSDKDKRGNVSVMELHGPRGPIYLSSDGNHRLAAARLIGLRKVRGNITRIEDPVAAQAFWNELLVMLPPTVAAEVREFYDQLYPPSEEQRAAEAAARNATEGRMEALNAKLLGIRHREHMAAYDTKQKQAREEAEAKQRYALVESAYATFEQAPGFKQMLHQTALDYFWNAKDDYVRKRYRREVSENGMMPALDGKDEAHVLHVSVDAWPRDTAKEIQYAAIRAYQQAHPEMAGVGEERAPRPEATTETRSTPEISKSTPPLSHVNAGAWPTSAPKDGKPMRADEYGV